MGHIVFENLTQVLYPTLDRTESQKCNLEWELLSCCIGLSHEIFIRKVDYFFYDLANAFKTCALDFQGFY
jgi:hypothetical protein